MPKQPHFKHMLSDYFCIIWCSLHSDLYWKDATWHMWYERDVLGNSMRQMGLIKAWTAFPCSAKVSEILSILKKSVTYWHFLNLDFTAVNMSENPQNLKLWDSWQCPKLCKKVLLPMMTKLQDRGKKMTKLRGGGREGRQMRGMI